MKQHMLTHKIRDMPPGFDKGSSGPTGPPSEEGREPSPILTGCGRITYPLAN